MTMKRALVLSRGLCLAGPLAAATFIPIRDRELFDRADVVVHGDRRLERRRCGRALAGDGHRPAPAARPQGTARGAARDSPGRRRAPGRRRIPPPRPADLCAGRGGRRLRDRPGGGRLPDRGDAARKVLDRVGRVRAALRGAGPDRELGRPASGSRRPSCRTRLYVRTSSSFRRRESRRGDFPPSEEPDSLSPPRDLARFLDGLGRAPSPAAAASPSPVGVLTPVLHAEERRGARPGVGQRRRRARRTARALVQRRDGRVLSGRHRQHVRRRLGRGDGRAGDVDERSELDDQLHQDLGHVEISDSPERRERPAAAGAPASRRTRPASSGAAARRRTFRPIRARRITSGAATATGRSATSGRFREDRVRRSGCDASPRPTRSARPRLRRSSRTKPATRSGLDHPDQFASAHDLCPGDESSAIMNSTTEGSSPNTALGTDDQDAIRWLYGDGGNHCGAGGTPTRVSRRDTRTPRHGRRRARRRRLRRARRRRRWADPDRTRRSHPSPTVLGSLRPRPATAARPSRSPARTSSPGAIIRIGGSVLTNVVADRDIHHGQDARRCRRGA